MPRHKRFKYFIVHGEPKKNTIVIHYDSVVTCEAQKNCLENLHHSVLGHRPPQLASYKLHLFQHLTAVLIYSSALSLGNRL